jgi:hypothetical protein
MGRVVMYLAAGSPVTFSICPEIVQSPTLNRARTFETHQLQTHKLLVHLNVESSGSDIFGVGPNKVKSQFMPALIHFMANRNRQYRQPALEKVAGRAYHGCVEKYTKSIN